MLVSSRSSIFFFFNDTATTEIYTLSLHDALPIAGVFLGGRVRDDVGLLRRVEHLGIVAVRAGNELAVGADPELTAAPVERPRRVVGHLGRARGIQAAVVPHHSYFGA